MSHVERFSEAMSWTRRDFLVASSVASIGLGAPIRAQAASRPETRDVSCIFLLLVGGPSQIDTWDMKPLASAEYRGPFRPIETNVPGIWISEHFPRLAQIMDRVAIVRTLGHHSSAIHDRGHQVVQTGRDFLDGVRHPHFGSVVAFLEQPRSGMPPHCLLPGPLGATGGNMSHGQDGGYLGEAYAPVHFPDEPSGRHTVSSSDPASDRRARGRASARSTLIRQDGPAMRGAGSSSFARNCRRAVQLVELGARFVTVNMFQTVFHEASWDIHGDAPFSSFESMRNSVCPQFDLAYSALIEDLQRRGLLETTMVVAVGEFGRTPRINGFGGRDHHSSCWSALFAGGRIRGGSVVGATDKIACYPADRPVSMQEFAATIYEGLGVSRDAVLTPDGLSSIGLVDAGIEPVHELF